MLFDAIPARRNGAILPNWMRHAALARGRLVVEQAHDPDLNRWVRTARLRREQDGQVIDALPPLRDVQIVAVIENRMTLTGFEIGTGHVTEKAHYQQSWLLELVTHETLRREAELTEQWVADAERSRAFSRHVAEFVGPRKPIPSHPRHRHR